MVTVTQTHGERVTHLHSGLVTWLRGYVVTQLFVNFFPTFFFNRNRNQRNLVTVTVTQTHGERVTHLHSGLVTWLRGYVVTQLFVNFFPTFFFNRNRNQRNLVTVTVTQTHGERVSHLHSSLVTWLRGYVVTQIFQTTF